jgi:hypothetical protein
MNVMVVTSSLAGFAVSLCLDWLGHLGSSPGTCRPDDSFPDWKPSPAPLLLPPLNFYRIVGYLIGPRQSLSHPPLYPRVGGTGGDVCHRDTSLPVFPAGAMVLCTSYWLCNDSYGGYGPGLYGSVLANLCIPRSDGLRLCEEGTKC